MNDKEAALIATDIIRTISDRTTGIKKVIGKILNKLNYMYYKLL